VSLATYLAEHPELRSLYRTHWRVTLAVLSEQFTWEEIATELATVQPLPLRVVILGGIRPAARCLFRNKDVLARAVSVVAREKHNQRFREYEVTKEHGELLANASVDRNKLLIQLVEAVNRVAAALEKSNERQNETSSR
jgi:hypothetical protein